MRTNYKNHWMLAAILFCGLVMISCSDQQGIIDNPVTPEPEQASATPEGFIEEVGGQANTTQSDKQPSISQIINENPDVMAHLVPICGKGGTRGIPEEWSFIKYILDGMGIDATQVFIYEDMDKTPFLTPMSPTALILLQLWQGSFKDQTDGADILKDMVKIYHKNDYGFISQKTMEEFNIEINKDYERYNNDLSNLARTRGGDNTTKTLSLKVLEQTMEHDYLPYLRSKMVADQLVPPGLKEEYQKYCDEMKGVFAQRIKNNDWLSDGSKKNALEKLDAMVFNVVYPDKWYTEGLTDFTKSQSLLEDIYTMRKARLKLMKQRFFLAYAEEYRSKYDANYVNRLAFGNDNPEAVNGHSMNKERVNGVVANMDGWYDAFDIEEGALYRKPAERIHI